MMRGLGWLSLVASLALAVSGCGWKGQETFLQPNEEVLVPQSNQSVVVEYFPFNIDDFPGLKERLKEAIRQDFKERYGKDVLEVRIGFPQPLMKAGNPSISGPYHDRTAKVFEAYIDQIVTKIKSSRPIGRIVTTPDPMEFCKSYKALDKRLERSELVTKSGWVFSIYAQGRSFDFIHGCFPYIPNLSAK